MTRQIYQQTNKTGTTEQKWMGNKIMVILRSITCFRHILSSLASSNLLIHVQTMLVWKIRSEYEQSLANDKK